MVKEYTESTKRLYNSEYWKKNKDRLRESNLARVHAWRDAQTPERMYYIYLRKRAKKSGIPFNLVLEDIDFTKICPVLGIPIYLHKGGAKFDSFSTDRIFPKLGYVKGNIQSMSKRANAMKNDASVEELFKFADWVYANYERP